MATNPRTLIKQQQEALNNHQQLSPYVEHHDPRYIDGEAAFEQQVTSYRRSLSYGLPSTYEEVVALVDDCAIESLQQDIEDRDEKIRLLIARCESLKKESMHFCVLSAISSVLLIAQFIFG